LHQVFESLRQVLTSRYTRQGIPYPTTSAVLTSIAPMDYRYCFDRKTKITFFPVLTKREELVLHRGYSFSNSADNCSHSSTKALSCSFNNRCCS
jgi:hypothetical protein